MTRRQRGSLVIRCYTIASSPARVIYTHEIVRLPRIINRWKRTLDAPEGSITDLVCNAHSVNASCAAPERTRRTVHSKYTQPSRRYRGPFDGYAPCLVLLSAAATLRGRSHCAPAPMGTQRRSNSTALRTRERVEVGARVCHGR